MEKLYTFLASMYVDVCSHSDQCKERNSFLHGIVCNIRANIESKNRQKAPFMRSVKTKWMLCQKILILKVPGIFERFDNKKHVFLNISIGELRHHNRTHPAFK